MHDGCNARVWVQVLVDDTVSAAGVLLPRVDPITDIPTRFLTRVTGPASMDLAASDQAIATERPEVFEPLADITLFKRHDRDGLLHVGRRGLLPARRRDARHARRQDRHARGR